MPPPAKDFYKLNTSHVGVKIYTVIQSCPLCFMNVKGWATPSLLLQIDQWDKLVI